MNLSDVERRVGDIGRMLGVDPARLPTVGRNDDPGARPFIEQVGEAVAYVVEERGAERHRRQTSDEDELLYWVFVPVTGEQASRWAATLDDKHAFRTNMFNEQLRLLGRINPVWARRRLSEIKGVLERHPLPEGQSVVEPDLET